MLNEVPRFCQYMDLLAVKISLLHCPLLSLRYTGRFREDRIICIRLCVYDIDATTFCQARYSITRPPSTATPTIITTLAILKIKCLPSLPPGTFDPLVCVFGSFVRSFMLFCCG